MTVWIFIQSELQSLKYRRKSVLGENKQGVAQVELIVNVSNNTMSLHGECLGTIETQIENLKYKKRATNAE